MGAAEHLPSGAPGSELGPHDVKTKPHHCGLGGFAAGSILAVAFQSGIKLNACFLSVGQEKHPENAGLRQALPLSLTSSSMFLMISKLSGKRG